jgi:hypothetical protein
MNPSVQNGRNELCFQFERDEPGFEHRRRVEQYGAVLIGYSQGAIATSQCWEYDIKPEGGRLHWAKDHILKAVTFGNPMREQGKAFADPGAPMAGPNSHGIADQLMVDTPSWWRNYAHKGDLYTDCEGESGEDKTAIYKVVIGARIFSGPDSLLAQVLEVLGVTHDSGQLSEAIAIFQAVMDGGMFFAKGTGPHVNYNIGPAIDFLRDLQKERDAYPEGQRAGPQTVRNISVDANEMDARENRTPQRWNSAVVKVLSGRSSSKTTAD